MKEGKVRGLVRVCLCMLFTLIGMGLIISVTAVITTRTGNEFMQFVMGRKSSHDMLTEAAALTVSAVIQNLSLIIVPVIMALYVWKKSLSDFGLTSFKRDWKDFVVGLAAGAAGITIAFILLLVSGSAKVKGWDIKYTHIICFGFLQYIAVGFAEEFLFRGGFMLALRETKSKVMILAIPAVVFGLMHLGNNGISVMAVINLILYGLLAGYCFYRSGNIWLPAGFHITWNFVQGNVYGFSVSGFRTSSFTKTVVVKETPFTGGAFGPEGGIGVTIALVIIFVGVYYYYRNRPASAFMEQDA